MQPPRAVKGDEAALLRWLDHLDDEAISGLTESVGKSTWSDALDLFRGDKDWGTESSSKFAANITAASIERKNALLTETKPQFKIASIRKGYVQTTQVLQQTIDAGWEEYGVADVLESAAFDVGIFGCTYIGIEYDPFANYGLGDVVLRAWDPRQVGIDPFVRQARDLDAAEYMVFDSIESIRAVQERNIGRGAMIEPDSIANITRENSLSSELGFGTRLQRVFRMGDRAQSKGAIDRTRIRRYFFRDPRLNDKGFSVYPNGRRVIRSGSSLILDDRPLEYWDYGWPVVMMDGHYDPDHPFGRSEAKMLRKIQMAINRIGHAFVDNTILTGNVWITTDVDALAPDVKRRLSNLSAVILEKKFGRQVDRSPPPQMPSHFLDFIRFAIGLGDLIIGLTDGQTPTSGRGRVEVRSGEQLEGLQQAAQILVRAQARRLESMLQRLGQKWISRIFQFYTADRILTYVGDEGEWQQFEFERSKLIEELVNQARTMALEENRKKQLEAMQKGEPTTAIGVPEIKEKIDELVRGAWRVFRFRVTPGSSVGSSKVQRAMMWAQLAQNMLAPRTKVLEALGEPNPDELIARAVQEAQVLGPPQPPKGGKGKKAGGL